MYMNKFDIMSAYRFMKRQGRLKLVVAAMLLAIVPASSNAQIIEYFIPKYLTGELGGGLHSIQFTSQDGRHKCGAGFSFQTGCVFMIDDNWGVNSGLGLSSYRSRVIYNDVKEVSQAYDSINDLPYEFHTYYTDFSERQNMLQLEIPITAYCQYPIINNSFELVGKAGFRLGIPVNTTYKLLDGVYETRGYYPLTKVEYHDMPQHGFSAVEVNKEKGKCKLKPVNLSFLMECGMAYKINKAIRVYAGFYFSYCMSNIRKENNSPVLSSDLKYNGTLNSNQTDKARLVSVGMHGGVIWDYRMKMSHRSGHKIH